MSPCISRHGEFSDHAWGNDDGGARLCRRCGVVDHSSLTQAFERADAEVKRLRIQLGAVKALATLWEEEADEREQASQAEVSPMFSASLLGRAILGRDHANAIRETLGVVDTGQGDGWED